MRKRVLLQRLRRLARDSGLEFVLLREGGSHEIWLLGGRRLVIPRHSEINEQTAEGILARALVVGDGD